jgi:hypothetical protein
MLGVDLVGSRPVLSDRLADQTDDQARQAIRLVEHKVASGAQSTGDRPGSPTSRECALIATFGA